MSKWAFLFAFSGICVLIFSFYNVYCTQTNHALKSLLGFIRCYKHILCWLQALRNMFTLQYTCLMLNQSRAFTALTVVNSNLKYFQRGIRAKLKCNDVYRNWGQDKKSSESLSCFHTQKKLEITSTQVG